MTSSSRINSLLFKTSQLQRLIAEARRNTKPDRLRLLRLQSLKLSLQKRLTDIVPPSYALRPVLIPIRANSSMPRTRLHIVR